MELDIHQTLRDAFNEHVGIGKRYTMADVHTAIVAQFPQQAGCPRTLYTMKSGPQPPSFATAQMVMSVCPEVRDAFELLFHGHDEHDAHDSDIHVITAEAAGLVTENAERFRDGVYCHRDRFAIGKRGLKVVAVVQRLCRRLIRPRLRHAA